MAISIGGRTPAINATTCTIVKADKPNAIKPTYVGAAYFAWPASIVGKTIDVKWNALPAADFDAYDVMFAADTTVIFDPDNGTAKTYNCKMVVLDGEYNLQYTYRTNVLIRLLILSEVA